ncbi:MAG TPA: NlpC/P60 family protein, partial [Myxococcota bacterium]|nr:NlpC/P60 family protein [Myxococcota bacterium]
TPPAARRLETWLALTPDLDRELMDPPAIAALNERNRKTIGAWRDPQQPPPQDSVDLELKDRLDTLGQRVATGELVSSPPIPSGEPFERVVHRVSNAAFSDRAHLLVEPADLRCVPTTTGLYRGRVDPDFDRNQCSRLHPGDLVRVQRETADGWLYVRAGHGVGWLHRPTLTPALSPEDLDRLSAPRFIVVDDLVPAWTASGELHLLRLGGALPAVASDDGALQLLVPTVAGLEDAFVEDREALTLEPPTFTRRAALGLLFARLMDPYGWGGLHGFRDCSALLLDTLSVFGVKLGRHSSIQAQAGARVIDTDAMSESQKLAAIREAHREGLVFLYMPGHIMVYLGDLDGRPYAISAISEYLLPCPEGGHQTVRIDRVDVTDLARGEHTERTSFLRRISRVSVFGPARPGD